MRQNVSAWKGKFFVLLIICRENQLNQDCPPGSTKLRYKLPRCLLIGYSLYPRRWNSLCSNFFSSLLLCTIIFFNHLPFHDFFLYFPHPIPPPPPPHHFSNGPSLKNREARHSTVGHIDTLYLKTGFSSVLFGENDCMETALLAFLSAIR